MTRKQKLNSTMTDLVLYIPNSAIEAAMLRESTQDLLYEVESYLSEISPKNEREKALCARIQLALYGEVFPSSRR